MRRDVARRLTASHNSLVPGSNPGGPSTESQGSAPEMARCFQNRRQPRGEHCPRAERQAKTGPGRGCGRPEPSERQLTGLTDYPGSTTEPGAPSLSPCLRLRPSLAVERRSASRIGSCFARPCDSDVRATICTAVTRSTWSAENCRRPHFSFTALNGRLIGDRDA